MARGGRRTPRKPAAVSGPGALSARTDGGPGDMGVGLGYGENKAVNDMQSSAPMQSSGGGGGGPAQRGGVSPMPRNGVFGPTDRPGEPLTAGIDWGPGAGAPAMPRFDDDANYRLRAIAAENPHLADYLLGLADA